MKKFLAILLGTVALSANAQTQIDAFPGAEGGGRYTTGGRGGKVIHVTNLNDSGTGSLRAALAQSGARIIVFDVAGTIALKSALKISKGDVTIAGQTAPGDGICIKDNTVQFSDGVDNVIVRFLRFRMGDVTATENDAFWGRNCSNIIIDHCSMSWCTDECGSFYNNKNFTMQWCILGESLKVSVHDKGNHGYGGIWGGQNASFHHNLLLHHDSRNPRFCGVRFYSDASAIDTELCDMRNNVIYNWGSNSGYAGEGGRYNFVNNYYKAGPGTTKNSNRIFCADKYTAGSKDYPNDAWGTFYVNGNTVNGIKNYDWSGMTNNTGGKEIKSTTEFEVTAVTTHTAEEAFEKVLGYAGASLMRDAIDARYARETRNGQYTYTGSNGSKGGLIDSQADVGGWPNYTYESSPIDTDQDGMPDNWETKNGLDPKTADNNGYDLNKSYTNIEVYINSLVDGIMNCSASVNTDETYNYSNDNDDVVLTESKKWDFTSLSSETKDNLLADNTNWSDKADNRRQNAIEMSGTIKANNTTISETDGLIFSSLSANKLLYNFNAEPNNIQLNGKNLSITIKNVVAGAQITIDFKSANATEARGWTATNATLTSGVETTIERTTSTYAVTDNGDVTFSTTGGLNVYSISLSSNSSPISNITNNDAEISSKVIYSLDGKIKSSLSKGLNIIVTYYNDGSKTTKKVLVK